MEKRASLLVLICSLLIIAGCAASREAAPPAGDYVEIDNPAFTMSPNAPPTIWVPRSYVESKIPRGSELIQMGYESLRGTSQQDGSQQQANQPAAPPVQGPVASVPAVQTTASARLKNRDFVLEVGQNGLLAGFSEMLRRSTGDLMVDPGRAAAVSRYAAVATQADRKSLAVKLREDFEVNLVIFVSAPDGISPGRTITAEIYEANGGALVRRLNATIPSYEQGDASARQAAVATALQLLVSDVKSVSSMIPWYGRVVAVEGDRLYVNAGKESGLATGRNLVVYRDGTIVERLGFAPGKRIGVMAITGYVGTDGAFGVLQDGEKAEPGDLVGLE